MRGSSIIITGSTAGLMESTMNNPAQGSGGAGYGLDSFRPDLPAPVSRDDAEMAFVVFQAIPIPYVEPLDISNQVLFLASDESRYVTGLNVRVDAGSMLKDPTPGS